jgi:HlyD family secretion protein
MVAGACLFAAGCSKENNGELHGYVEGEFVYIASPLPGTVSLQVARGDRVKQGAPLFALDSVAEMTARDEASRRLAQAKAALQDLGKGLRPTEVAGLQAKLQQAREALKLAESELARQERLFRREAIAVQDLDRSRSAREQQVQQVARLEAELQTARLGGRSDQLAAAEANVRALAAALARAQWELSQKSKQAPVAGLVYDTLYRSGEFVAAGRPVVALLPPENIKVRVFVPEAQLASVHAGDPVTVTVDGVKEALAGRVSYLSPRAEYTPPVIYSRESRAKLVFMVEAVFPPEIAARLNPGQPVDLRFGK